MNLFQLWMRLMWKENQKNKYKNQNWIKLFVNHICRFLIRTELYSSWKKKKDERKIQNLHREFFPIDRMFRSIRMWITPMKMKLKKLIDVIVHCRATDKTFDTIRIGSKCWLKNYFRIENDSNERKKKLERQKKKNRFESIHSCDFSPTSMTIVGHLQREQLLIIIDER